MDKIVTILEDITVSMYKKSQEQLKKNIVAAKNIQELKEAVDNKKFVKAMWCGNRECEDKIKEQTSASTRVIPFKEEKLETKCVCCGKKAKHMVYFAKSY